jgi:hypothetical protein
MTFSECVDRNAEFQESRQLRRDMAFNMGSDARIAGHPLRSCELDHPEERSLWKEGWFHVHWNWGRGANRRWEVMSLPEGNP